MYSIDFKNDGILKKKGVYIFIITTVEKVGVYVGATGLSIGTHFNKRFSDHKYDLLNHRHSHRVEKFIEECILELIDCGFSREDARNKIVHEINYIQIYTTPLPIDKEKNYISKDVLDKKIDEAILHSEKYNFQELIEFEVLKYLYELLYEHHGSRAHDFILNTRMPYVHGLVTEYFREYDMSNRVNLSPTVKKKIEQILTKFDIL